MEPLRQTHDLAAPAHLDAPACALVAHTIAPRQPNLMQPYSKPLLDEPVRLRPARPLELSASSIALGSVPASPTDSFGTAPSRPPATEFDDPPPPPPPAYHPLAYEDDTANEPESAFYLVAPPPEGETSPHIADPHRRRSTDDHILLFSGHDGDNSVGTPSEDEGEGEYESEDSASYESEDLVRERLVVVGPRSDSGADELALAFDPSATRDEDSDTAAYGDDSDQVGFTIFEDVDGDESDSDIDGAPVELEPVQPDVSFKHEHEDSDDEPIRKRRRLSPPDSPQPELSPADMNDYEEGEIPDDELLERSPSAFTLGDFSPVFSFYQRERSRLSSAAAQPASFETSTPVRQPSSLPSRLVPTPSEVDSSPLLVTRVDGAHHDSSAFAARPAASTSSSRPSTTSLGPIPFPSYSRSNYDGSAASSSPVFSLPAAQPIAASASLPAHGALPLHRHPRHSAASASDAEEADHDGEATMDMDMSFDDLPADLVGDPTRRAKGPISILQRPLPLEKASYQRRIVQPLDLHAATPKAGPAVKPIKLSYVPSPIQPVPSFVAVPLTKALAYSLTTFHDHSSDTRTKPPPKRALKKKDRPKSMYERPNTGAPLPPNVYNNNLTKAERLAYDRRMAGFPDPSPAPVVDPPKPQPTKAPGALPLSRDEKLASLPAKLVAAFPQLSLDEVSSPRLFAPSPGLALPAKGTKPPSESTLFGFWPAPPSSLTSGKNVYPAPPVVELDPADAQRARVDIFIDHSNVLYSFLNWARARPEATILNYVNPGKAKVNKTVTIGGKKARIDYDVFFALLERGRKAGKRVLVGSSPLWQGLESAGEWGYEISVLQRVQRPVLHLTGATKRKLPPQPAVRSSQVDDLDPALKGKLRKKARQEKYIAQQEKSNAMATGQAMARPHATHATGMGSGPPAWPHPVNPSTIYQTGQSSALYQPGQPPMFPHPYQGMHPHGMRSMVVTNPPAPAPPPPPPVEKELKAFKEQAVDEIIHLKILESLLDYTPDPTGPRPVIVLATGDANSSEYNPTGFLGCVRRALERGWDVEIVAFPMGTSASWLGEEARATEASEKEQGGEAGGGKGRLRVVDLEAFAEELVL